MQYLLQPKRSQTILQTTAAVERWECDVREHEQRFGKNLDEEVKIGVILALAAPEVRNPCHSNSHILKSYAQDRTMLFESPLCQCIEAKEWWDMHSTLKALATKFVKFFIDM